MHSLTLRELVLIGDVTAGHVSFSFGQNHAAHMRGVDFDRLHGPIFTPGVEHHVAVDLMEKDGGNTGETRLLPVATHDSDNCNLTHLCKHKGSIKRVAGLPVFDGLD